VRSRDEQDFTNPGLHQGRQRVVNHRLVVHRHELLADAVRERMESGAGTAGQDDAFHSLFVVLREFNKRNLLFFARHHFIERHQQRR
jgi:hypothetical protein